LVAARGALVAVGLGFGFEEDLLDLAMVFLVQKSAAR